MRDVVIDAADESIALQYSQKLVTFATFLQFSKV